MKTLYRYQGAVWNGNVIYKTVDEYIHATSKREAIVKLERRLKTTYKDIGFIKLKEANLGEVQR